MWMFAGFQPATTGSFVTEVVGQLLPKVPRPVVDIVVLAAPAASAICGSGLSAWP